MSIDAFGEPISSELKAVCLCRFSRHGMVLVWSAVLWSVAMSAASQLQKRAVKSNISLTIFCSRLAEVCKSAAYGITRLSHHPKFCVASFDRLNEMSGKITHIKQYLAEEVEVDIVSEDI